MIRAIRSELVKLRTTNTWWLLGLGIALFAIIALAFNMVIAHVADLSEPGELPENPSKSELESHQMLADRYQAAHTSAGLAKIAANLYTSGQFFGVMLVMVLGAILITNESFHQTATATFLTIPRRIRVILAKYLAAITYGGFAWLVTTVISVAAGVVYLRVEGVGHQLAQWAVIQAMLLNLAVYAIWAVLGVSLGVLLRSQIVAVITGTVLYLIGSMIGELGFTLVRMYLIKEDWVLTAQVVLPSTASTVMVTPGEAYPHAPAQWVGAAVLIGYGLAAGVVGTLISRRRDIA